MGKNSGILYSITQNYKEQKKLKVNCSIPSPSENSLNIKDGEIWSLRGHTESQFLLVPLLQHLFTLFRHNLQVHMRTECSDVLKKYVNPTFRSKKLRFCAS